MLIVPCQDANIMKSEHHGISAGKGIISSIFLLRKTMKIMERLHAVKPQPPTPALTLTMASMFLRRRTMKITGMMYRMRRLQYVVIEACMLGPWGLTWHIKKFHIRLDIRLGNIADRLINYKFTSISPYCISLCSYLVPISPSLSIPWFSSYQESIRKP